MTTDSPSPIPPAIPPRPSRSPDKTSANMTAPVVPPRPARRFQRSVSPSADRFAPSPLISDHAFVKSTQPLQAVEPITPKADETGDPIERAKSVELPSLGEEGKEYEVAEELAAAEEEEEQQEEEKETAEPEQTRTVAKDLHLHAPKPSLPAVSAKQRITAVTRTDSERAAAFGFGKAPSVDTTSPPPDLGLKKKASTTSQLSGKETPFEDEQGIPQIGQRVPMYKNAGDVQAPSPSVVSSASEASNRHHNRKTSSRGLPPGSYGLHGHGVLPQDKLEKAYFDKHPDLLVKERKPHHYDRPNDFSLKPDDLNKIVRETASHGVGLAAKDYAGTPSEQVGWQALEESASRIASPGVPETATIHVEEPSRRISTVLDDAISPGSAEESPERNYTAPILAEDEVAKDPRGSVSQPAVVPSTIDVDEPTSRPTSRPASRPVSMYKEPSVELHSTPLEDVEEYEPLFKDDEKHETPEQLPTPEEANNKKNPRHRFPSADVWEDAPSSAYYTAEVSTPDVSEEQKEPSAAPAAAAESKEGEETPAHAFARRFEQLAEKEEQAPSTSPPKPLFVQHQKHLAAEAAPIRPGPQRRFPSRDVWEDTPESLQLETTVSTPQQDEASSLTPVETRTPAIPERPKPRQASSGENEKPPVPERAAKPAIPPRPVKAAAAAAGTTESTEAAALPRTKPAVPARPMGSKIAALQAGFMNDLNRRLALGPQAVQKKEEPAPAEEEAAVEKEKVPLSDARKGRARGPQRRAPASVAAAAAAAKATEGEEKPKMVCRIVGVVKVFEIDPDSEDGGVRVGGEKEVAPVPVEEKKKKEEAEEKVKETAAAESEAPATISGPQPAEAEEGIKEENAGGEEAKVPLATNLAGETLIEEKKVEEAKPVEA
ncbi:hypothetical protein VTJ49DRAFT_1584 [Mycothermus thermophilus]|uniref:Altered inheritance of mitochondria protein 21 n=1 Tax=Humicola insolens TaxID=85995 RepID=A0ABR3VC76_HUMIN